MGKVDKRFIYSSNRVLIRLFILKRNFVETLITFELRGGRWSRFPAKIRSTVASSRVIFRLFHFLFCCFNHFYCLLLSILISYIQVTFRGVGVNYFYGQWVKYFCVVVVCVTFSHRRHVPLFYWLVTFSYRCWINILNCTKS